MNESKVSKPLRLLYLPNENSADALQNGPRRVFSEMVRDHVLTAYQAFSFQHEMNQCQDIKKWERKLLDEINTFNPTVIFWQHVGSSPIDEKLVQKIKHLPCAPLLAYHEGDVYGKFRKRITPSMKILAKYADVVFLVGLGENAQLFKDAGAKNIVYSPSCVDPQQFGKEWEEPQSAQHNVVMIGNNLTRNPLLEQIPMLRFPGAQQRELLAAQLAKKLGKRFTVYGSGWQKYPFAGGPIPFTDQEKILRRHILSVNWDHFPNTPGFFSNRLPISLISGVAHATNSHPGYDSFFNIGEDLVVYQSVSEAVDQVDWLLSQPQKYLMELGKRGEQFARRNLTVDIVYARIVSKLKEIQSDKPMQTSGNVTKEPCS